MRLPDPTLLRRYWLRLHLPSDQANWMNLRHGTGVSAYTSDDALHLIRERFFRDEALPVVAEIVANIDIATLDRHIRPNIDTLVSWRGIWYPR